jgi:hypothetical protein
MYNQLQCLLRTTDWQHPSGRNGTPSMLLNEMANILPTATNREAHQLPDENLIGLRLIVVLRVDKGCVLQITELIRGELSSTCYKRTHHTFVLSDILLELIQVGIGLTNKY